MKRLQSGLYVLGTMAALIAILGFDGWMFLNKSVLPLLILVGVAFTSFVAAIVTGRKAEDEEKAFRKFLNRVDRDVEFHLFDMGA